MAKEVKLEEVNKRVKFWGEHIIYSMGFITGVFMCVTIYFIMIESYIWAIILAKKVLKEHINLYKWSGVVMIIVGVIFIV